ncbi:hypothetical protein Tco_0835808 [Tanacetum coccineum]
MFNSFHAHFIEGNQPRPLYYSNLFKQLSDEDSHILDCSFTIEEINEAVLNFVNSSPTKMFKIERRLHQGDLLSPFLIILAIEAFNVALLEASNCTSSGVSKWGTTRFTFLISNLWLTLLKVNFNKSKLYGIGASNMELNSLASTIVNGSPTKEFKIERGLRQGDLLSPFLIILAMEAFSVALLEASNCNIFRGIKVGNDSVHLSHLQFAAHTLILGDWSRSNAMNLLWILTVFISLSALRSISTKVSYMVLVLLMLN